LSLSVEAEEGLKKIQVLPYPSLTDLLLALTRIALAEEESLLPLALVEFAGIVGESGMSN
jgi:hypothetical protein